MIFAGALWLYWPSTHGGFLRGDDTESLRQSIRWDGLTWNAVKWAFTSTDPYYDPLPRLSHVLDYQIWGKQAAGHHATSVVVHALNAALVFGFLWTLLGATSSTTGERLMVALWVAVVFAIHPLQTESVAWISVRNTLLCTTFGIGSLWAYAAGARRWLVWALFVAALLCKPMAVSLPFVMLAIDYFPLRRHERLGWGRLLREKAVLIALAGVVGVATMITKSQAGQMIPLAAVPLSERVLLAFESLTFYPLKLVWPARLSPHQWIPFGLSLDQWPVLASVLGIVIITAVAVVERRRMPPLAAAWGAYVMLVLPVSGLFQGESVGQRYAYIAMLPLLLVAGGAGVWVTRRGAALARVALIGLLAGQLCVFAVRSRRRTPDWHSDETLRRAALAEFPDSEVANRDLAQLLVDQGRASEALQYAQRDVQIAPQLCLAHVTLGVVLNQLGKVPEAAEHFEQALRIQPDYADAHYNLGVALAQTGKIEEAIAHYQQALRIKPDYADAHNNLGVALEQAGRIEEAIVHFEQALRIKPDYAEAHCNLGITLAQAGKTEEAIAHFEQALRIKPGYAEVHNNLGNALMRSGRMPEAIEHLEQALRIKPDFTEVHNNLGIALMRSGRFPEAAEHWEQVVRLKPGDPEAHDNLGVCLEKTGKVREAIAQYQEALRLKPDLTTAQNDLAWSLATHTPAEGGDPVRAVTLAQEACERAGNRVATDLDTLAAAYAAAGRFNDAGATAEKAIELARSGGQPNLAARIEARLELYRSGHAYRQSVSDAEPHTR